jgi:DNA mismatch repair protein MutL
MTPGHSAPLSRSWIRPLPERVINKIAAGEVIERPASVVKELVENAIDAGADRIEISVEKSGIKLVRIVDNGCGIPEDQIEVAFGRHATSKISTFDDLEALLSYGFRGEALPSIASVSRLRMVSRPPDQSSGTEIVIEGGVTQSVRPVAAPVGTSVEVQNLFFNTPARRKFLKAESTEARHVSRIATALALGRPDIGVTYRLNGRSVFTTAPRNSLRERTAALLGRGRRFVDIADRGELVEVVGCVGAPDNVQHNRNGQYIFVNDRVVFSPVLAHALAAGYGELIPGGVFPVGVLMIRVDPRQVDVNVHPSKTEVRLSHEREVHEAVRKIVKEGLRRDGIIPRLVTPEQAAGRPAPGRSEPQGGARPIPGIAGGAQNAHFIGELYRRVPPPDEEDRPPSAAPLIVDKETGEVLGSVEDMPGEAAVPDAGPSGGFRLIGRFADLYLLLQAGENLYIVDQHTAHERVLYEETLDQIEKEAVHGQALLFPAQAELTPEQYAVFEENRTAFGASGFTVEPFGGRTVRIEAVPAVMARRSPEKAFAAVLDDLASLRKAGLDLSKAMAQSIACRGAVKAGDRLSDTEAVALLEALLRSRDRYSCPHGRPTFIKLSRADLDKQFGRE